MDFKFPDVGEGLHEAKLVKWHVKEGDNVKEDDILAEVETDKAVVDIPSPHTGTISKLHVQSGEQAIVGELFITFDANASAEESSPERTEESTKTTSRPQEKGTKRVESSLAPEPPTEKEHSPPATPPKEKVVDHNQGLTTTATKRVLATPSTRRLARELGVDLQAVNGTGPSGRVTKQDVQASASVDQTEESPETPTQSAQQPPQQPPKTEEVAGWQPPPRPQKQSEHTQKAAPKEPPQDSQDSKQVTTKKPSAYTGVRKAIGEHMEQAAKAPAVTLFARADLSELVELRLHLKEWAQKQGAKLTYLPLIAKAVCGAIKQYPEINASFTGKDILQHKDIHLGIAVDTEKGLFVPVIKHADSTSVLDIAKRIDDLASKARDKKLSKEEMTGSTFTISSIGPLRVEGFTPVLNAPEVGILGVGTIKDEPWVVDGEVLARKICTFSLTFDHRALDGAQAAKFLTLIVELLEDPEKLILEGV